MDGEPLTSRELDDASGNDNDIDGVPSERLKVLIATIYYLSGNTCSGHQ